MSTEPRITTSPHSCLKIDLKLEASQCYNMLFTHNDNDDDERTAIHSNLVQLMWYSHESLITDGYVDLRNLLDIISRKAIVD
jgi:hypothetical protein